MIPNVVVDVGNTRIKWGLCDPQRGTIESTVSLPEDPNVWWRQLLLWQITSPLTWVLASVHPSRCERLQAWLEEHGHRVFLINRHDQLPLQVGLEHPDKAGMDRLLDAVAAKSVLPAGQGGVLIDAGSAVTVDWLDEQHIFRGGMIMPGMSLMAEALHNYTALLPRVEIALPLPELPGESTIPAMQLGIFLAVTGGIREAVRIYREKAAIPPKVFFTGGQCALLAHTMDLNFGCDVHIWPNMTLVGILRSAEGWHV
jgi:type III pantothenate kinase